MKYCRHCGAQLQDNAVTCFSCRTKQTSDAAAYKASQNMQYTQPQQFTPEQQYDQNQQYTPEQQYGQNQQYAAGQQYSQNQQYAQPEYMPAEEPPKTPGWLIALIAGLGAVILIIIIIIVMMMLRSNDGKDKDQLLEIATEQYSITTVTTTQTDVTADSILSTLPDSLPEAAVTETTTTAKTTAVSTTKKRPPVIQTANTRPVTTTSTTTVATTTTPAPTTTAATTTKLTTTEAPLEDIYIELSEKKILTIDTELLGNTREELMSILGVEIPEPKEFPWYGTDLMNSDVTYNDADLCFMFQYDKLVMIIYDVMEPMNQEALENACEELGLDADDYNIEDGIEVQDPNGNIFQMFGDVYAETGEECYHQRYVYNGIK